MLLLNGSPRTAAKQLCDELGIGRRKEEEELEYLRARCSEYQEELSEALSQLSSARQANKILTEALKMALKTQSE